MIYLDPKSDIAFKKLFGNNAHKNIVISFLNNALNRPTGAKIVDVIINEAEKTDTTKSNSVHVCCTDQSNNQAFVEIQLVTNTNYIERAQYYNSLGLSKQLCSDDFHGNIIPVITIDILDFNLFPKAHYVSRHQILDSETYDWSLKKFEWHFIELKKFTKQLDALSNTLDKWIYFLKHAATVEQIPAILKDSVFKEAFSVLSQSNWTTAELEAYEGYLDTIRSAGNQLDTAKKQSHLVGKREGRVEGKMEEKIAIAKKLLALMSSNEIANITGLTVDDVEKLKNAHNNITVLAPV